MKLNDVAVFSFIKNGQIVENSPKCYLSLLNAGSMRFRWNEQNENRKAFIRTVQACSGKVFVPVELNHTKDVYVVNDFSDTYKKIGDGIVTKNHSLVPCVTVADCVPIYFYDNKTKVFGIVHSGWKGTGIIENALLLAQKEFGSCVKDFSIVIGPHIKNCCYIVNEERAIYFAENFGKECIVPLEDGGKCFCGGRGLAVDWNNGNGKLYRLSLEKANLFVLEKLGVKKENIFVADDCTCCNTKFGSNRRQTALGEPFCVQIAFVM